MAQPSKWIEGISPNDAVTEVAQQTLAVRLGAVEHSLPLAAYCSGETTENVHQLRVSTRRARAAIRLYRDFLPTKRTRWIKKQLRRIRRTAGEARDCDVLIHRLSSRAAVKSPQREVERILRRIRKQRTNAQPGIVSLVEQLTKKQRFHRRTEKLLQRIRPSASSAKNAGQKRFDLWAPEVLESMVVRFFATVPGRKQKLSDLHRFRIRGKELRYAMELLAPAFSGTFRSELYPLIDELQKTLGELSDHSAALERYKQLEFESTDRVQSKLVRHLLEGEEQHVAASRRKFHAWWTVEHQADLQRRFDAILQ